MWIELLWKIRRAKWLPWVGMSPFLFIPLYAVFTGRTWPGLGLLAFFSSFYGGILLGRFLGSVLSNYVFRRSQDFGQRLAGGLSGFGFLFLPTVVGLWSNSHLGTDIGLAPLWQHFLWACVGGAIFFCTKLQDPET
jgi:hypothetical protein